MRVHKKIWLLITATLIILAAGGGLYMRHSNSIRTLDHPEYLSFVGNNVFSVPKDKIVDERAIAGMQLVLDGTFTAKDLAGLYEANNIAIQPIAQLKDDHKPASFKKYVNDTFVPDVKKNSPSDVAVEFAKANGWDVARVTARKDGKPYRFIYLKNGLHPLIVISKEETDTFKKIEASITDVEKTDLKDEIAPLKKAVQDTAQLLRDKNAAELYKQAAPDLRSKNTQDDVSKILAAEEVNSQGLMTINGGSYANNEFGAVINFAPLNKDFKPASGVIYLQKIDGQWRLKAIQLPNPTANQVKS